MTQSTSRARAASHRPKGSFHRALCAIIAAAASSVASPAHACSCREQSLSNAIERSPVVFVGIVREVDGNYPVPAGSGTYLESGRRFRLEVLGGWKGARRNAIVLTGSGGGDCGFDFVLGEVYLVYVIALRGGDTVMTSICSRTRRLIDAAEDSTALGKPVVDYSSGRPWRDYRPGTHCPVHRESEIEQEFTNIVFELPRRLDPEYRKIEKSRFPYAGLQIDRPPPETHDDSGQLFRGINRAFVCPQCRRLALDWCRKHGGHTGS